MPFPYPDTLEIESDENLYSLTYDYARPLFFREEPVLLYKLHRINKELEFSIKHRAQFLQLTKREKEVIVYLLQGLNNPQIARELFISRRTVEQHRKNINKKLNIHNFSDLVKFGYAFNLV